MKRKMLFLLGIILLSSYSVYCNEDIIKVLNSFLDTNDLISWKYSIEHNPNYSNYQITLYFDAAQSYNDIEINTKKLVSSLPSDFSNGSFQINMYKTVLLTDFIRIHSYSYDEISPYIDRFPSCIRYDLLLKEDYPTAVLLLFPISTPDKDIDNIFISLTNG